MYISKSSSGFTILEIIIALAIVGMGFTLTVSMFQANRDISRNDQDIIVASLIGQKKMEEILQMGFDNVLDESDSLTGIKEFCEDGNILYPKFRWSMDIVEQEKDLLRLRLDVIWPWPKKKRNISFSTYLAKRS